MNTLAAYRHVDTCGEAIAAGPRLLLFAAGAAALLVLQHVLSLPLLTVLATGGIAIAIWHGAFDLVVAGELFPRVRRSLRWRLPFAAAYLALALAVVALWWLWPPCALAAFLLYSAWHFGTESLATLGPLRSLAAFCYGAVPIAAACRWHGAQVQTVFAAMLHGPHAGVLAAQFTRAAGGLLWPLVVVGLLGLLARTPLPRFWPAALAVCLLLFRFAGPLLAFAVYFCLWHTPEHMLSSSRDASGRFSRRLLLSHLVRGVLPWLISLAGLGILCVAMRGRLLAGQAALFILLSALTVPHMLLNEARRWRERPGAAL